MWPLFASYSCDFCFPVAQLHTWAEPALQADLHVAYNPPASVAPGRSASSTFNQEAANDSITCTVHYIDFETC